MNCGCAKGLIMFEKSPFDTLLTEEQAALRLGINLLTIRRYRKQGKLGFITIQGRIRFRLAEIQRFEESGGEPNFKGHDR
ncbi:MAG: hypothetical protein CTY34_05270 [Methylobacter sp.]|nr:MAG: hypothetical protein CTY34_05270 [Methylobacter sp.]PPD19217.1 MAG: hypothetical protein CTY24_11340 [Methylobacter sp.]PPD36815.1 MAG: hypothetical protein CTY18_03255 [Methylomonas sp.]